MTFQAYLEKAMRQPNLDADEEKALVTRMCAGDDAARTRIVEAHVKLIAKIARPYVSEKFSFDDLIQQGVVGFAVGLQKYNPDNEAGARIGTYCAWYVRAEILELVHRQHSLIRMSSSAAAKRVFFNVRRVMAERGVMDAERMTESQAVEVADALGVPISELRDTLARMQTLSRLDGPIRSDDEESGSLLETVPDGSLIPIDEQIGERQTRDAVMSVINERMAQLTERERAIIEARVLNDKPTTLDELSKRFGISRERARQVEAMALFKLGGSVGQPPSGTGYKSARLRMKRAEAKLAA